MISQIKKISFTRYLWNEALRETDIGFFQKKST